MKITTLKQLAEWNQNPSSNEKPVLLEWFLDYFFGLLLHHSEENTETALEAYRQFILFTINCERLEPLDAAARVIKNLTYYSRYSATNYENWKRFLELTIRRHYGSGSKELIEGNYFAGEPSGSAMED